MTSHELPWIATRTAAGVCALFVSIHGLWNIYGLDFRIDTLISALYCLLPFLSFFVFLFVKILRIEVCLHALVAVGYLATFSFLNWRTCSAIGYCTTIAVTIAATVATKPMLAAFAVVLLSVATLLLDTRESAKHASRRAN
jgi:hypothetical protein